MPVYNARLRMGDYLAEKIKRELPDVAHRRRDADSRFDPPVRDAGRAKLGVEYREGFFKNRYVGRTFIMPGQAVRKKSVRQKLNAMASSSRARTC